jgi:nitrate reductase NapE component
MAESLRAEVTETVRETVPFLVIVVIWTVVSLALYGVFLVTKPSNVDYDAWVYVSVFAVPMVGFVGHVLRQALKAPRE